MVGVPGTATRGGVAGAAAAGGVGGTGTPCAAEVDGTPTPEAVSVAWVVTGVPGTAAPAGLVDSPQATLVESYVSPSSLPCTYSPMIY